MSETGETLNRVPRSSDFELDLMLRISRELHIRDDHWRGKERKPWEWAMVLRAFERHGFMNRSTVALGIASGFEAPVFALTNRIRMVVASDLYGLTAFSKNEASTRMLASPGSFWPHQFERNRLIIQNADATSLPFGNDSFDVLFSCSSVEHFGPDERIAESMSEAWRVLRPGGMYALSVDYLFRSPDKHKSRRRRKKPIREYLTQSDVETLIVNAPGFVVAEPVDYTVPEEIVINLYDLESGKSETGAPLPHLCLRWREHFLTSLFIVLFKPDDDASCSPSQ